MLELLRNMILFNKVKEEKSSIKILMSKEQKAYNRLHKLIHTLYDLNPDIREIQKRYDVGDYGYSYYGYKYNWYAVETDLGMRFIKVCIDVKYEVSLAYGEIVSTEVNEYDKYGMKTGKKEIRTFSKFFKITLNDKTQSISIEPNLDSKAKMNEKQIYLALLEVENIINKYPVQTITEEHTNNKNRLIERFANE